MIALGILLLLVLVAGCSTQKFAGAEFRSLGRDAELEYYSDARTGTKYLALGTDESSSFGEASGTVRRALNVWLGSVLSADALAGREAELEADTSAAEIAAGVRSEEIAAEAATQQLEISTAAELEAAALEAAPVP